MQQHYGVSFYQKKKFLIMIYVADIAILMSNFDDDQISSKLLEIVLFLQFLLQKNF